MKSSASVTSASSRLRSSSISLTMENFSPSLPLDVAQMEKGYEGAGVGSLQIESIGVAEDNNMLVFVGLEGI